MTSKQSSPAYQVRILDPEMQRYLQKHPFANGPDVAQNRAARVAIKTGLRRAESGTSYPMVMLKPEDTRLPDGPAKRLQEMFANLALSKSLQAQLLEDFGWEAKLVPPASRRILVVGCGDGTELLFLRAFLPEAEILALDYADSVSEQRKQMIRMEFIGGDMHRHLKSLQPVYDLIYSNHTLEHLYTPEETIATLCRLLAPGGSLVSALPMDGNPGSPFLGIVERLTTAEKVHPLDYVFLDAGHPWKTNPGNLNSTLRAAGFSDVVLYQRTDHPARLTGSGWGTLAIRQTLAVAGNLTLFGTLRSLLKLLFPSKIPEELVKGLFAIERRTPFGANKVKTRYTHEVLVHATKGG